MKHKTIKYEIPPNGFLDVVASSSPINFKLIGGKDAEIFGYPLTKHKSYSLNEGGIGIYSWKGCKVEVIGHFDDEKNEPLLIPVDSDKVIEKYLMAHSKFREIRSKLSKTKVAEMDISNFTDAEIQNAFVSNLEFMGPRILVLGAVNCGKSTLCKSLINWAQRMKDEPIFIDLDCGQNGISLPGTLSGQIMKNYLIPSNIQKQPIKINEEEQCQSANPFIYYYGQTSPSHFDALYKHYLHSMAVTMKKKMLSSDMQRRSGCIINSCGFIEGGLALSIIKQIVHSFCVNFIIFMDFDEEKQKNLIKTIKCANEEIEAYNLNICQLPKTKSIKIMNKNQRFTNRQRMCKSYFYGLCDEYTPFEQIYLFKELSIFQIIQNYKNEKKEKKFKKSTNILCKYVDYGLESNQFKIFKKRFDESMIGNIIAVTHAQKMEELAYANVAGFLFIKNINFERKEVTVLQSCVGSFPGLCLYGNVKWDDTVSTTN